MKKILFLIHDLGHGGAEKVLVNLVNNMDPSKFDISVTALFGGGVNEQYLKPHIHYRTVFKRSFPGNSHLMKLFSPKTLYRWFVKGHYDVVIAYLEGPSTRIISGCTDSDTEVLAWVHCSMKTDSDLACGFRSFSEAKGCYSKMDTLVFVSQTVRDAFLSVFPFTGRTEVLNNTNDTEKILALAREDAVLPDNTFCWCGVGKLAPVKGFDRMIRIQKRLSEEGYRTHLCILGDGVLKAELVKLAADCGIADSVTFFGYQTNPYKYVARCDLFVCSSHSEGFSTAATEALIVGTPVCTVEVSGMKEMLGEHNEYGIVTDNDEDSLYQAIKKMLDDPDLMTHYKQQAVLRGKEFSTEHTVQAVSELLMEVSS